MQQLTKTLASSSPSWPASFSEILQIFGPLEDYEFRRIANLIFLGSGIINRKFNFSEIIYQKICQEINDSQIQFNFKLNKWISNNSEYSEDITNFKKNYILDNWNGSLFGKGEKLLYVLIDNRCLYDLIMKKSTKHFVKIGKTNQKLTSRIKDLNTGNPFGVRPIVSFNLDNPMVVEKNLHKDLNNYKMINKYAKNQEWFYVDSETLIATLEKNLKKWQY